MAFAWSRVVGQFVAGCVIITSVPKNYWPGIARKAFRLLFNFGIPLASANFINYILLNVDYALVGHLLRATVLGIYVLAFNAASWPASLCGNVINSVSMPAFSRVKHDPDLVKSAVSSSLRMLALVVLPMSAMTVALARPLVLTLYGHKWLASAGLLSILTLYGAISVICLLFANILSGLGRTKFILAVQIVWLAALVPMMIVGVRRDRRRRRCARAHRRDRTDRSAELCHSSTEGDKDPSWRAGACCGPSATGGRSVGRCRESRGDAVRRSQLRSSPRAWQLA